MNQDDTQNKKSQPHRYDESILFQVNALNDDEICLALEKGANPNQRFKASLLSIYNEEPWIFFFIFKGLTSRVFKALLEAGLDLECTNAKGETPLFHYISSLSQKTTPEVIEQWNELGVMERQTCEGLSPLQYAVLWGHDQLVEAWLETDPSKVQDRSPDGDGMLSIAAQSSYAEPTTTEILLRFGADPLDRGLDGDRSTAREIRKSFLASMEVTDPDEMLAILMSAEERAVLSLEVLKASSSSKLLEGESPATPFTGKRL